MMFDMNMLLSHKQALAASGDSTNGYDRLLNGDDLQRAMSLVVFVNAVTGTGTIAVTLKTSADGETWTDAWASSAVTAAPGCIVRAPLPHGLKRYVKLGYTLTGSDVSVTVTGGITDNVDVPLDTENVQKRDPATGEIADLAAETDALNATVEAEADSEASAEDTTGSEE